MVTSPLQMVAGETDLKEIISTNGRMEQFKSLLENGQNDSHVKKKLKYIDKDIKYPKAVIFIIGNEFCERFTFYGLRAILYLYLINVVDYPKDTATVIFHTFLMAAYFFPIVGAIIADSFLGRFRTIFYISMIYALGSLLLAFSSSSYFHLPQRFAGMIGLLLIAFGTGGIKPCVSAFGGDQFVLPQQEKELQQFFSVFYFSINAGSLISSYVTPFLRHNVHCFDSDSCYPLAFGVPAALMVLALSIFLFGKRFYVIKNPEGNIIIQVVMCMSHAFVNKICNKGEKKSHWLNYAEDKYDLTLIEDIKSFLRVLLLFLPIPVFWALFDQQGSRWTFQATFMNGSLGWLGSIKAEQMITLNPFLVLFFIPLFQTVIYPTLAKFKISRPLQKITVGGFLSAFAFVLSGILELQLQKSYAVLPGDGLGQLRIYNSLNCSVDLNSNISLLRENINAFEQLEIKDFPVENLEEIHFSVSVKCSSYANQSWEGSVKIDDSDNFCVSYLITEGKNSTIEAKLSAEESDDITKSKTGVPKLRILYRVNKTTDLVLKNGHYEETLTLEKDGFSIPMKEIEGNLGSYEISINGTYIEDINLEYSGVYSLLVVENNDEFELKLSTIQNPNKIHMLWQIPQYMVITAGEVMVSVTGLELSYSQAPVSMKSVVSACWLLTVSLGNLIVIVIAKLKFDDQAVEFFVFALMMIFVMGIFMIIAYFYKYVNMSPTAGETNT